MEKYKLFINKTLNIFWAFYILGLLFVFKWWQYGNHLDSFIAFILILSAFHFVYSHINNFDLKKLFIMLFLIKFTFLFTDVFLSDDIFRYLWDGYILNHGYNPYSYPPNASELNELATYFNLFSKINHKELNSFYLVIPELSFFIVTFFSKTVFAYKFFLLLVDTLLFWLLYKLDIIYQKKGRLLFFVLAHPLYMFETFSSAHFDAIFLTFFVAAFYFYKTNNYKLSFFMFSFSILTKGVSLLFFKVFNLKKSFVLISISLAFISVALIYSINSSSLNAFHSDFHFNNLFFSYYYSVFYKDYWLISSFLSYTFFLKILVVLTFVIVANFINWRKKNDLEFIAIFGLLFVLTFNPLYPWYVLFFLPFMYLAEFKLFIFFSYSVLLSYFVLIDYYDIKVWQENTLILILEYVLPLLLLCLYLISKKINLKI